MKERDFETVRKCPACDDDGGRCEMCGAGVAPGDPTYIESLRAKLAAAEERGEALEKALRRLLAWLGCDGVELTCEQYRAYKDAKNVLIGN